MTAVITPLVSHLWRQHRWPLLVTAAGVMLFELVITRLAPAPDEVSWMSGLVALVPPQLLTLAGGEVAFASPSGVIAIGYNHPFFLLLLGVWSVRVPSSGLAGEIGRGTMDLLAARPVGRGQVVLAAFAALAGGLALLVSAAWVGTTIGLSLRPLGLPASQFVSLAAMAWLLFASWGAVGLAIAATRREAGPAIAWTSGVMAAAFVIDYLARVWTPMAGFKPFSPFAYYRPQQIVASGLEPSDITPLAVMMAVAVIAAIALFRHRDL